MTYQKLEPYFFLIPALAILFFFLVLPFFWNVYISFHDVSMTTILREWKFSSIENFLDILDDRNFHTSVKVSLIFVSGSVGFQFVLGLIMSIILNQKIKGSNLFLAVFIIPWTISSLIAAFSFKFLFDTSFGLINYFLNQLGFSQIGWLSDPNVVIWSIIIANVWYGTPFTILFLTAGLLSINQSIYESATIDGASKIKSFIFITLPLMKPFILINLILITVWSINFFEIPLVMTGGNPLFASTPASLYMYRQAFEFGLFSKGAASGIILLIINLFVALIYLRMLKKREDKIDI